MQNILFLSGEKMCGIFFKTNYYQETDRQKFEMALKTLAHRGPDDEGILYNDSYSFGHRRLAIQDLKNGKQPMSILNNHIVYNGELYNTKEITERLKEKPKSFGDTEALLRYLIEKKEASLDDLNGIFAFVYTDNEGLLAARDPVGVKPLYYTMYDGELLIASEIKALLSYGVKPVIGKEELCELLAMAPSSSPGKTLYKGIYELKPGHYLTYSKGGSLEIKPYFSLKRECLDLNQKDASAYTNDLVSDSIRRELVSDSSIASFLSGGLDSSIIASCAKNHLGYLDTYSIDYEGNSEEFKPNQFEITRDEDFIKILNKNNIFNHHTVKIDTNTLFDYLKIAVVLRDGPGMADIDSSLLYLAKEVSQSYKCALSGECADELFAGYPWFKDYMNMDGFPWIRNVEVKERLLKPEIARKLNLKNYLKNEYEKAILEAPVLESDSLLKRKELQMNYLNIKYFMPTLLTRKDRMTMGASLEVRVPYADKRIVNFAYNLPYSLKSSDGKEKVILKDAFRELLPVEIISRKKSPYPKSGSSLWHKKLKDNLLQVLDDTTPLNEIFDMERLRELATSDDEYDVPWFGQLMRRDALMAFIYQIHYWLKEYKIRVEI